MSAEADAKIAEMIRSRGLDFGPTIIREANRAGKGAEAMGGTHKVENQCRLPSTRNETHRAEVVPGRRSSRRRPR